jgi:hypothetical protein
MTKYMIQLEHVIRPISRDKVIKSGTYTSRRWEERKAHRELAWGHSDTEFKQLSR